MSSQATYVHIRSCVSGMRAKLTVHNIDNHDWDGSSRPDHNLNGRSIACGESICEREEINTSATRNMYNLVFNFDNGDKVDVRVNQGRATDSAYSSTQEYTGASGKVYLAVLVSAKELFKKTNNLLIIIIEK